MLEHLLRLHLKPRATPYPGTSFHSYPKPNHSTASLVIGSGDARVVR